MWSLFYGKTEVRPPAASDFGPWAIGQLKGALSTGAVDALLLQKEPLVVALSRGLSELPTVLGGGGATAQEASLEGILDLDDQAGEFNAVMCAAGAGAWCCLEASATPLESGMVSTLSTLLQLQRYRPKAVSLAMELLYQLRHNLTPDQCQLLMSPLLGVLKVYKGKSGLMVDDILGKGDESTTTTTSSTAPKEEIEKALWTAQRVTFASTFLLLKATSASCGLSGHTSSRLAAPSGLDVLAVTLNCVGSRSVVAQAARCLEDTLGQWSTSDWGLEEEEFRVDLAALGSTITRSILLWQRLPPGSTKNEEEDSVPSSSSAAAAPTLGAPHLEPYYYCFLKSWILALLVMDSHIFPVDLSPVGDALCAVLVDPWAAVATHSSSSAGTLKGVLPSTLEAEKVLCCHILEAAYTKQWLVPTVSQVSHLISACGLHEGEVMYSNLLEAVLSTLTKLYWAAPPYVTQVQPVLKYLHRIVGLRRVGVGGSTEARRRSTTQPSLLVAVSTVLTQWILHQPNIAPTFGASATEALALDLRELLLCTLNHMVKLPSSPHLLQGIARAVGDIQKHIVAQSELKKIPRHCLQFEPAVQNEGVVEEVDLDLKKLVLRNFLSSQVEALNNDSLDVMLPLLLSADLFPSTASSASRTEGCALLLPTVREQHLPLVDPMVRLSVDKVGQHLRHSYNTLSRGGSDSVVVSTTAVSSSLSRGEKSMGGGVVGKSLQLLVTWISTSRTGELGQSLGGRVSSLVSLTDSERLRVADDLAQQLLFLLQSYPGVPEDVELLAALAMLVEVIDGSSKGSTRSIVEGFSIPQWKSLSRAVRRHTGWVYDAPIVQESCRMLERRLAVRPTDSSATIPRLLTQFDLWMALHSQEERQAAMVVLLCHHQGQDRKREVEGSILTVPSSIGDLGRTTMREVFRFLYASHVELQPRAFFILMASS